MSKDVPFVFPCFSVLFFPKQLTVSPAGVMIFLNIETEIEVAFFISRMTDVSGTEELIRKGKMPKGQSCLKLCSWACREEWYDCHRRMESYLVYLVYISRRHILPFLFMFTISILRGGKKNGNF